MAALVSVTSQRGESSTWRNHDLRACAWMPFRCRAQPWMGAQALTRGEVRGGGGASMSPAGIADSVARPRQGGNRPQSRVPGKASAVLDSRPHGPVRGPAGHGGS